jgi:hypothetical protein
MSIQSSRSLGPLLIGSLVVLSAACRRDDRSNMVDTTSPSSETARSSESPALPGAMPGDRPSSTDLNPDERMPVAGRDDMIDLGAGGSTGMGGSGGSAGSHH